jgi:hypothetical protein
MESESPGKRGSDHSADGQDPYVSISNEGAAVSELEPFGRKRAASEMRLTEDMK